jgi:hypothetical protein
MKIFIFLCAISFSLASCYHVYYAPNTVNAPMLSEKNELRVNALVSNGAESDYYGGELQLAYAVQKHLGIMVNGLAGGKEENTGSYNEKGNGSYGEIGAGYFGKIDPKGKWIAEIYGGFGLGSVTNDYGLSDHSKVAVKKLFVQPAIGFRSKFFEAAFVPRIAFVNWKVKEEFIFSPEHDYDLQDLQRIRNNPHFLNFEPGILLRAGGEYFKVQAGLSFSNLHATAYSDLYESANGSIGISINVHPRKKLP